MQVYDAAESAGSYQSNLFPASILADALQPGISLSESADSVSNSVAITVNPARTSGYTCGGLNLKFAAHGVRLRHFRNEEKGAGEPALKLKNQAVFRAVLYAVTVVQDWVHGRGTL
ncbi:hypothetical protein Pan241w_06970 [Gimesia alba]|uniref:Uncharacterized protein n=1 Tax=Gimesia alba TaxID=2527973 RepID=A0A517R9S0_9PLAN|nr:hypothetical protein Pan241w_06970 [Gimesia alba]